MPRGRKRLCECGDCIRCRRRIANQKKRDQDPEAYRRYQREYSRAHKVKKTQAAVLWAKNNPERVRERAGMRFSEGQTVASLLEQQNNLCALCGGPFGTTKFEGPAVDHCHVTGKVRAILHGRCNIGIGHFFDSAELCRKAAIYLSKAETV